MAISLVRIRQLKKKIAEAGPPNMRTEPSKSLPQSQISLSEDLPCRRPNLPCRLSTCPQLRRDQRSTRSARSHSGTNSGISTADCKPQLCGKALSLPRRKAYTSTAAASTANATNYDKGLERDLPMH